MNASVLAGPFIWLLPACLLSACATPGARYQDVMQSAEPVGPDQVRIVFLRPKDRDDGGGDGGALIGVNDKRTGALRYGGFFYEDAAPGEIRLLASGRYRVFGACEIDIEAPAGFTIYVDVGPRMSYMIAGALGGVAGAAAGASAFGNVFGSAGEAVAKTTVGMAAGSTAGSAAAGAAESRGKACSGPYRLEPISEHAALPRLEDLVWSK